ncbi:MAG: hypothetical protein U0235_14685 [Polyangiaceae bacterium]
MELGLGKDAAIVTDLGKSKKQLSFDVVQIFVGRKRDIETRARRASEVVGEGGAFWVAYPKQGSGVDTDVTRDAGQDALTKDGWAPVARSSRSTPTWSSMRFKKKFDLQAARRARARREGAAKPTSKAPAKSVAKVAPATKPAAKPAAERSRRRSARHERGARRYRSRAAALSLGALALAYALTAARFALGGRRR